MNTDIIKGRTINSTTLFDNFNQELNVYDVIISCKHGKMVTNIITDITDGIIKVHKESGKYHKYDVILANKILSPEKIKSIQDDYFKEIETLKNIKNEQISRKYIMGIWKNIKAKTSGLCIIPVASQPGKNVLKSDFKRTIIDINSNINNQNYIFSFFTDKSSNNLSKNINDSYLFSENGLYDLSGFYYSSATKFLLENITTSQLELGYITSNNKNVFLIIMDTKKRLTNNYPIIKTINFTNSSFIIDNTKKLYSVQMYQYLNNSTGIICRLRIDSSIFKNIN